MAGRGKAEETAYWIELLVEPQRLDRVSPTDAATNLVVGRRSAEPLG
jgi:hypothetical protein